ncbi:hypothetical protein GOODEAATRI_028525 [Goodea atripinnis]|uniref:Uncharacterized protein n=1 Tax=Goodea atripinnis TaxID=208336 RepID=A0ABV0PHZ4_9TELE
MKIVNYSRPHVVTTQPASQPVRPVHLYLCVKMIRTKQFRNELHQKLSWMSTPDLFRQPDNFNILPPGTGLKIDHFHATSSALRLHPGTGLLQFGKAALVIGCNTAAIAFMSIFMFSEGHMSGELRHDQVGEPCHNGFAVGEIRSTCVSNQPVHTQAKTGKCFLNVQEPEDCCHPPDLTNVRNCPTEIDLSAW